MAGKLRGRGVWERGEGDVGGWTSEEGGNGRRWVVIVVEAAGGMVWLAVCSPHAQVAVVVAGVEGVNLDGHGNGAAWGCGMGGVGRRGEARGGSGEVRVERVTQPPCGPCSAPVGLVGEACPVASNPSSPPRPLGPTWLLDGNRGK